MRNAKKDSPPYPREVLIVELIKTEIFYIFMSHELIVGVIMLSMGILGGLVAYLATNTEPFCWIKLSRNVTLGLAAAILVPLFLRMISSNLVEEAVIKSDGYFVFAGFCMVAALSSQSFISSVTRKLLNEIQEKASSVEQKLEAVESNIKPFIERSEEPDSEIQRNDLEENQRLISCLADFDLKILKAMDQSEYAVRTAGGICQQLNLALNSREVIRERLIHLKELGLVNVMNHVPANSPRPRWYLSVIGRSVLRTSSNLGLNHSA